MDIVTIMAQTASGTSDYLSGSSQPGGLLGSLIGIVLYLGIYALFSYLLGRIFTKAGERSWKAWVPIYNTLILFKIGGYSPWLVIVPFVNVIVYLAAHYRIGKNLGKSGWFLLLALFFYPIWLAWLALDGSIWKGAKPAALPADAGQA